MSQSDFFVGFLTTPPPLGRFLRRLAGIVLIAGGAVAILVGVAQRDPGTGVWDPNVAIEMTGVIRAAPYPFLEIRSPAGRVESVFLVNQGKVGAQDYAAKLDGQRVVASGYPLSRNGLSMLELIAIPQNRADADSQLSSAAPSRAANLTPVTLRGQIVDPKCYLGAMKPGEGKPHKACAVLCIRGGIPPVLISESASGELTSYVLVDQDGNGLSGASLDAVLPFVADSIELSGQLEAREDLQFLRISTVGAIRRL